MNKIFNINLGGYPFVIDEDAFHYLQKYLKLIKKQFNDSEGYEEIVSDIECRLAELIEERLDARQIVGVDLVEEITAIMGEPELFADEEDEILSSSRTTSDSNDSSEHKSSRQRTQTRGRRLFRDPENKVFGGVCSGVAAYVGIQDPLWVRIAFAFFGFSGLGFLIYIILLIIIPQARTSADRLAMHGEPINIDNIAKTVEEEFENLSGRFKDVQDEFGFGKKKRHSKRKRKW